MTATVVVAASREMLLVTLTLATPFLGAALATAIVIGLLQAGTRVNDLTLSFVPRFVAVLAVTWFSAQWALAALARYFEHSATTLAAFPG